MNWEYKKLGNLCTLITDGKHGDCKNEENSGYYFISAKDIRDGKINYEGARQIVQSDFEETNRRTNLQSGDVLVTNSGTIGRLALTTTDEKTHKTTFQKSVAILKPVFSQISSHFLYYSLSAYKSMLIHGASGAAQKNLLLGQLRDFKIPVPPLPIQQKIADILSAYDALIENNRRRIQLLEESARLLYQEWFVHLRFPGHEHVKVVDGVPEGWEKGFVADFGQIITGKTPSTNDSSNYGDEMAFVKTPDMHDSRIILFPEEFLSEKGAATQANKTLPVNSILVACIGAKLGVVSITGIECQTNQQINAVIPKDKSLTYYAYFLLKGFRERLLAIGGGATMPNVNKSKFESLDVVIPSKKVLQFFQESIADNFSQMKTLMNQNQKLAQARDILLPRLMNGEVEV